MPSGLDSGRWLGTGLGTELESDTGEGTGSGRGGSLLDLKHVSELGPLVGGGDFPASRLWEF